MPKTAKIYECGICGCYHPLDWDGDCRDDSNRYGSPEEYQEMQGLDEVEVVDMPTWEDDLTEFERQVLSAIEGQENTNEIRDGRL